MCIDTDKDLPLGDMMIGMTDKKAVATCDPNSDMHLFEQGTAPSSVTIYN
jgi:hypothetical protein